MKHTIFILTQDNNMLELLSKYIIDSNYSLHNVNKNNLLSKMYDNNPSVLIIDIDSFTDSSLSMISSVISLNYIPTICISNTSGELNYFPNSININKENIQILLPALIKQAIGFSERYRGLSEVYDTIGLMNSNLYSSIDEYINSNEHDEHASVSRFLKLIYTDNVFLHNKPSYIWSIHDNEDITASLYKLDKYRVYHECTINIDNNNYLIFDNSLKSGFIKNLNDSTLSDVNSIDDLLPKEILSKTIPNNNIVSYGSNRSIIVALDYNDKVCEYEMNIIQALTINFDLISSVRDSIYDVQNAYRYTIDALARAAEVKDDNTGHHIKRVNFFSKILAEELGYDEDFVNNIETSAQMHDVGKIYVNENILKKPGKLTNEEFEEMKKHTVYGEKIIGNSENLSMASQIARYHHEKYDGSGYPDGKKGTEIPLPARIVSLADIYDALRSKRTYKPGFSHEKAYDIIVNGDGRVEPIHFDPDVLEAFKRSEKEFETVYDKYKD